MFSLLFSASYPQDRRSYYLFFNYLYRSIRIGAKSSGESIRIGVENSLRSQETVDRLTAHSGRVGLASELTARGASTTEVMLAGNWKTARMVAHYSAGAAAERGAVAKYL